MLLIFIPSIFFLFFTLFIYGKRGLDVSFLMAFIYLLSSVCAILLYLNVGATFDVFGSRKLGIIPAILFCFFPTLFIIPFYNYKSNKKRNAEVLTNTRLFDRICYLYIALFFINIFIYGRLVIEALNSDLGELRNSIYLGDGIDLTKGMSLPMKILFYIPMTLGGGSLFMLVFFFYSVTFLNKSKIFNLLLLVSTLSSIYIGIATATRTSVIYWFLMFFFCFMLFRKYMKHKTKKSIRVVFIVFGALMVVYFMAVSISRFSEFTGGTQGGLLGYAGQPYLEYSNLWETIPSEFRSVKNIFPWGNLLFWHQTSGAKQASEIAGYPINGFNTIMGVFFLDFGKIISLVVLFIYFFAIKHFVSKNSHGNFSLSSAITVFLFAIIPLTGIFSYYFNDTDTVFAFFFFMYLAHKFKKKNKMVVKYD